MAIEVFNRYEHKYLVTEEAFRELSKVINRHMTADVYNEHGHTYPIANIYYDTYGDELIRHSLTKPVYKEKLRLRSYGKPSADSPVFAEIKKKVDGMVNKRRVQMHPSEAYRFLSGGGIGEIKPYMNPQIIKEIEYLIKIHPVEPKLYLAYDRFAFFEEHNPDLRISFDTNIRSRRSNLRLENDENTTPLLPDNLWVMEVKTSRAKPMWLCETLSRLSLAHTAFSKYGQEFRSYCANKNDERGRDYGAYQ